MVIADRQAWARILLSLLSIFHCQIVVNVSLEQGEGEKNGRRRHRTPNLLKADLAGVEI